MIDRADQNPLACAIDWTDSNGGWFAAAVRIIQGDRCDMCGGKPCRKQVYTKNEILEVIQFYGWPQEWNHQGDQGPERYIEVQVWDERIIQPYTRT